MAATVRYLPCRGSHAAIMFCGLNICRVRSDTVWGAVYLRVSLHAVGWFVVPMLHLYNVLGLVLKTRSADKKLKDFVNLHKLHRFF